MATLLDHTPDTAPGAGALVDGVGEVNRLLDRMQADATGSLPPGSSCAGLIADLERIGRRVEALKLGLVAREESAAAAAKDGFPDTGSWLARQTRTSRPDAARQARLAADLAQAPATGHAMVTGALSSEHARVITAALATLPTWAGPDQRAVIEADLVAKAARFDPSQLRRAARRALEAIGPDPDVVDAEENARLDDEEAAARSRTRFTFHDNDDGTVTGHFTVPTLAFAFLRKILDAMTAPRRQHDPAGHHRTHQNGTDRNGVDWAARRGHAFVELLGHLPTDHLHNKTSATVVVHLDHAVLQGALRAAGLDTGEKISAAQARHLACTAGIIPAVFAGRSLALDLGREQRLFTPAQRLALSARHDTCAADDCQRPFAWCEIHHRQPWSRNKPTDLANAVPLCAYHHRRVHQT